MKLFRESELAYHSADFAVPRGAAKDNTHCPKFLSKCQTLRTQPSLLDLGCSGGGLVADFLSGGFMAYGIDGSTEPCMRDNSEWLKFPSNFINADLVGIFQMFEDNGAPMRFDFVTAWEVLEHIKETQLTVLFENIKRHMSCVPLSMFVGSISTVSDSVGGIEYHQTIKDEGWWWRRFEDAGLKVIDWRDYFSRDEMARGSGNPLATGDWNGNEGFHIAAVL